MAHPLLQLAQRLERERKQRRAQRDLLNAIRDPHIAQDVGLPYHPKPKLRVEPW